MDLCAHLLLPAMLCTQVLHMDAGIFVYPNFLSAGEVVRGGVGQEVGWNQDNKQAAAGRQV